MVTKRRTEYIFYNRSCTYTIVLGRGMDLWKKSVIYVKPLCGAYGSAHNIIITSASRSILYARAYILCTYRRPHYITIAKFNNNILYRYDVIVRRWRRQFRFPEDYHNLLVVGARDRKVNSVVTSYIRACTAKNANVP